MRVCVLSHHQEEGRKDDAHRSIFDEFRVVLVEMWWNTVLSVLRIFSFKTEAVRRKWKNKILQICELRWDTFSNALAIHQI